MAAIFLYYYSTEATLTDLKFYTFNYHKFSLKLSPPQELSATAHFKNRRPNDFLDKTEDSRSELNANENEIVTEEFNFQSSSSILKVRHDARELLQLIAEGH